MANARHQGRGGFRGGEGSSVADQVVKEIGELQTLSGLGADKLVDLAEQLGDFLANRIRLKTSQIRKFLDAVNEIKTQEEADFRSACMLLKPKLAYAAGRQDEVKPLMAVLVPCINKVHNKNDFMNFYRFVESIIAYHRYHGGRD